MEIEKDNRGGVLSGRCPAPEAIYKGFVTPASKENREGRGTPSHPQGRDARGEQRREPHPTSGEAKIKAVMLRQGSLFGGPPLVLLVTAALPLLFSTLGKLPFCDYFFFLKHSLLRTFEGKRHPRKHRYVSM